VTECDVNPVVRYVRAVSSNLFKPVFCTTNDPTRVQRADTLSRDIRTNVIPSVRPAQRCISENMTLVFETDEMAF